MNAACSANTAKTAAIEHPQPVRHKLGLMRDKNMSLKVTSGAFVQEVAGSAVYEITRHLSLEEIDRNPAAKARVSYPLSKKLAIVLVLRAGLGMVKASC